MTRSYIPMGTIALAPLRQHRHLLVVTPEVAMDLAGSGPAGKDGTGDDTPLGLPVDA